MEVVVVVVEMMKVRGLHLDMCLSEHTRTHGLRPCLSNVEVGAGPLCAKRCVGGDEGMFTHQPLLNPPVRFFSLFVGSLSMHSCTRTTTTTVPHTKALEQQQIIDGNVKP